MTADGEKRSEKAHLRAADSAATNMMADKRANGSHVDYRRADDRQSGDKSIQRHFIAMTHQLFVDHYVNRDMDAVLELVAEDLTWFGPMDCHRATSAEEMRRIIQPEYDTQVHLANENWGARMVGGAYVVFGTFVLDLREKGHPELELHQAVTAVWGMSDDGPCIVHLQVSSAYDVPSRIGQPLEPGENCIDYVLADVSSMAKNQSMKIRFESVGGQVHYLMDDEILYLETKRPVCNVVHSGGTFAIRSSLDKEAKRLPKSFVRVHRGYLVNVERVASVKRYRAVFDNGDDCPIAEHRFLDVVEVLEKTAPLLP